MSGPILVTGGAGSVGRLLVERCRADDHLVRVFDLPVCDFTGLEGVPGIEIVKGDITNPDTIDAAVRGASAVLHLAAILPPASEANRERTFAINVEGTSNILNAMQRVAPQAVLVFSSSVSTYGDTTAELPPVGVDHPQTALDIYAASKIAAEQRIRAAAVDAVILRIAGITVPELQTPPDVWPFTAEQRLEMVHRDDVVTALYRALITREARGATFNIAGGATWQTTGQHYVADLYELMGVPIEMAAFRSADEAGWVDWYDTTASQHILNYQQNPYPTYLDTIRQAIEQMMEE